MRILVPAASAALIAAAGLSVTAAVPTDHPRSVRAGSASPASTASPAKAVSAQADTMALTGADTAAGRATRVAPGGAFVWPLAPRPAVLRRFEPPRSQWSSGHRGVDLSGAVGQPVLSAGEGVVAFSGVIAGRGVVTVRHLGGLRTTYEPVDERLATATVVHRGARIGVISSTPGHCVPLTCLHWGAISGRLYRDPLTLLGFGRPILLPLG